MSISLSNSESSFLSINFLEIHLTAYLFPEAFRIPSLTTEKAPLPMTFLSSYFSSMVAGFPSDRLFFLSFSFFSFFSFFCAFSSSFFEVSFFSSFFVFGRFIRSGILFVFLFFFLFFLLLFLLLFLLHRRTTEPYF